jgi:hypothetical protein
VAARPNPSLHLTAAASGGSRVEAPSAAAAGEVVVRRRKPMRGAAMTEAEWLASTDPTPLAAWLNARVSERKARLYLAACCRRRLDLFPDAYCRAAIECGERFADGAATLDELQATTDDILRNRFSVPATTTAEAAVRTTTQAAVYAAAPVRLLAADGLKGQANWLALVGAAQGFLLGGVYHAELARGAAGGAAVAKEAERAAQADLLRDIVGNPFRPAAVDPRWRTAEAVELARAIYDDRAFDRLPLLADALRDAGCTDEVILAHCRSEGPHARGCWVVDLLLGRE